MKKLVIVLGTFALVSITSHAQLKVDSTGLVAIGNPTTSLQRNFREKVYGGVEIVNDSNYWRNANVGLKVLTDFAKQNYQFYNGVSSTTSGNSVTGLRGVASATNRGCGVFGGLDPSFNCPRYVGVYGSTTSSHNYTNGVYAGYFYGDVKTTGLIYGTLVSPSSASFPSDDGTTTNLSAQSTDRGESVTSKLQRVDLLQMERLNQDGSLVANKVVERRQETTDTDINDIDREGMSAEEIAELEALEKNKYEDPIQTRLSDVSYGLAADQLREVFPELVYEDAEGNYSINYIEMVPLLVQSIRELSAKVTTLEQQLGLSQPAKSVMKTKAAIATEETDDVSLIVPEQAKEATLNIYDMGGKLIQTATITDRGTSALSSYTKTLPTGIYIYSLIVDGKVSVTRKMIMEK